jgi:hypothetical protein
MMDDDDARERRRSSRGRGALSPQGGGEEAVVAVGLRGGPEREGCRIALEFGVTGKEPRDLGLVLLG